MVDFINTPKTATSTPHSPHWTGFKTFVNSCINGIESHHTSYPTIFMLFPAQPIPLSLPVWRIYMSFCLYNLAISYRHCLILVHVQFVSANKRLRCQWELPTSINKHRYGKREMKKRNQSDVATGVNYGVHVSCLS